MLALIFGLAACAPPPAPTEVSELCRYLFREWSNPDPRIMALGLENLTFIVDGLDLTAGVNDRSWALDPLQASDLGAVEHPDREPSSLVGVAVAHSSPWPIESHARGQVQEDQTLLDPSADVWDRSFPGVDDPSCFIAGTCLLPTTNDVYRQTLLMTAGYTFYKDLQWFDVGLDAWARAFVGQQWTDQSWQGEGDNTWLYQTFGAEVFVEQSDGGVVRFTALWSESVASGIDDPDLTAGVMKSGLDGAFKDWDDAIEELGL